MHILLQENPVASDPQKWLPLAAIAMAAVFFFIIQPLRKKRNRDPMESFSAKKTLSQQRHVEREMENLLVELSEMSRKITAQLDTRATKLELLIEEADQRIAQLRAAADSAPQSEMKQFQLPEQTPTPVAPSRPRELIDPRHAEVYTLADQGRSPAEIAEGLHRPRGEIELILALRTK